MVIQYDAHNLKGDYALILWESRSPTNLPKRRHHGAHSDRGHGYTQSGPEGRLGECPTPACLEDIFFEQKKIEKNDTEFFLYAACSL